MLSINNAVLVVIDVQGNLAMQMHEKDKLFKNIVGLIEGAKLLNIPILYTEQAPDKIGKTISEIQKLVSGMEPLIKTSFSCCGNRSFVQQLSSLHREQILIAGIESHVCVYQTVADLINLGYYVQVVSDAVSSRTPENRQIGLERMKTVGAGLTSLETVLCELIKGADHEKFREILNIMKS